MTLQLLHLDPKVLRMVSHAFSHCIPLQVSLPHPSWKPEVAIATHVPSDLVFGGMCSDLKHMGATSILPPQCRSSMVFNCLPNSVSTTLYPTHGLDTTKIIHIPPKNGCNKGSTYSQRRVNMRPHGLTWTQQNRKEGLKARSIQTIRWIQRKISSTFPQMVST